MRPMLRTVLFWMGDIMDLFQCDDDGQPSKQEKGSINLSINLNLHVWYWLVGCKRNNQDNVFEQRLIHRFLCSLPQRVAIDK